MRLYAGSSVHFIKDSVHNQIADKLKQAFFDHYRYSPAPAEIAAWRNSLRAMAQVLEHGRFTDHGILLEYQLPQTSRRLDCMLCGTNAAGAGQAVIVELKQWENAQAAVGDKMVSTWVGGGLREVLHPSVQVGQYRQYLQDTHTAFYEGETPVRLDACAYLHNYQADAGDLLFSEAFRDVVAADPVFPGNAVDGLITYLDQRLGSGEGLDVLARIETGRYRPSKKLMAHVSGVIKGKPEYVLLDEQLVVYETVRLVTQRGYHDRRKTVLIIQGGPGTGKSVIAINLMADLLANGYNAHYATGSRAFTETLRKAIGKRSAPQFRYFYDYQQALANEIDVLICDEAHRIRKESAHRFTPKTERTGKPQIEELIHAAKVGVFFIDNDQVVRPDEVGSVALIRQQAEAQGAKVLEYTLAAQFRCAGSDGFVNWIANTLGIARTAHVLWEGDENFEFRLFPSPQALEQAIREKAEAGHSARLTAGFCWPWSKPDAQGRLVDDVVIGDFRRPWNAKPEAKRLAKGIPKAPLWAYEPGGLEQIGCVYTAQGFEFDYVGVSTLRWLR